MSQANELYQQAYEDAGMDRPLSRNELHEELSRALPDSTSQQGKTSYNEAKKQETALQKPGLGRKCLLASSIMLSGAAGVAAINQSIATLPCAILASMALYCYTHHV